MPATNIPDGYGLIPGRGRENARKVLAAAEAAGVESWLVRTVDDGYIAPLAVLDKYEAASKPEPTKKKTEPVKRSAASKKKE
jgi:hypothetical protein